MTEKQITNVYWRKDRQVWQVSIGVGGLTIHVGYFKNVEDAILAKRMAIIEYGVRKRGRPKKEKS